MDPADATRRGSSPAFASRLPAKKNSFHSLRTAAAAEPPRISRHSTTSPSAVSDASSGPDASGSSANGFHHRLPTAASRRASIELLHSAASLGQSRTRIPRPSISPSRPDFDAQPTNHAAVLPTPRRPLGISDAYRMAEEEEVAAAAVAQGSPSPAPRPWRTGNNVGAGTSASRNKSRIGTPLPVATPGSPIAAGAGAISASESRMERILVQSPLSFSGRRTARRLGEPQSQPSARDNNGAAAATAGPPTPRSADLRRIRYEEDQVRMEVAKSEKTGLFSPKARVSPKPAVTSRGPSRRTSVSSLTPPSPSPARTAAAAATAASPRQWGTRSRQSSFLKRTVPPQTSKTDAPVDPPEAETNPDNRPDDLPEEAEKAEKAMEVPAPVLPPPETAPQAGRFFPNKSLAWDADADMDFTAGDLMVSESPRVKLAEVEECLDNGVMVSDAEEKAQTSSRRSSNPKLQEIRLLEIEVEAKFPVPPRDLDPGLLSPAMQSDTDSEAHHSGRSDAGSSDEHSSHGGLPSERTNKKIDEIRAREIESLSKRALAKARIDEIRERNAGYRTSSQENLSRKSSQERLLSDEEAGSKAKAEYMDVEGERIPGTPVTIFRRSSGDRGRVGVRNLVAAASDEEKSRREENGLRKVSSSSSSNSAHSAHSRNESQELLRSLARVTMLTSPSASKDKEQLVPGVKNPRRLREIKSFGSLRSSGEFSREAEAVRPAVGFAGLRRMSSSDSTTAKRTSVANSEGDPIDRIEAEMKLFAPTGDQSERGSLRASSPEEVTTSGDDEAAADEATPRPQKTINPLMQPTPRVTGAYVETPVTERTEKMQEVLNGLESEAVDIQSVDVVASLLRRRSSSTPSSDDGAASTIGAASTVTASTVGPSGTAGSTSRRRSRSLPRRSERRPLVNSARPNSARDDLLAMTQTGRVDDPTLDNFDALLRQTKQEADGEAGAAAVKGGDTVTPERLRRMSDSVTASLLNIQQARSGIEGLEDRVSQAKGEVKVEEEEKPVVVAEEKQVMTKRRRSAEEKKVVPAAVADEKTPSSTTFAPTDAAYVRIALPRLYRQGHLTVVGVVVAILAVWLALEGTVCALYCRPEVCSGQGCSWSPDDPSFGSALPVKLDQWLAGGRGRVVAAWTTEELGDWLADAWDAATGTDLRQVDPTYFSFEEKRRHRRRLQKHGLVAPWTAPEEARPRLEAWRRAREARELAREEGRDVVEESIADDEQVGWW